MLRTWQEEELELLRELAGKKTCKGIRQAINELAAEKGWPERSRQSVANALHKRGLVAKSNRRKVRCVDNGVVFQSVKRAASLVGVTDSAIANAARLGTTSAGKRWEYVDEP